MTVEVIGAGANECAQQEAAKLAEDGERFGVLVFPAATWETGNGRRSVIPTWFLCMMLDVGDSDGVAHCESIAPLAPAESAIKTAVRTTVAILRRQRDDPAARQQARAVQQPGSAMDALMGITRTAVPDPAFQTTSVSPMPGNTSGLSAV